MQCCSSTLHYATVFYPQTHKVVKARSFQPRLSVTPPPHKTHTQETRTSHDDDKPKLITSASNPFVKHYLKLRNNSSYRRSHGSVLVVGATPIREIYRFQESLQDESIIMDYLIIPDKAEIPNGLVTSTASIVHCFQFRWRSKQLLQVVSICTSDLSA
uniref:Uncharacterized protein n=1 Tax=Lotus japonicus TaxID=34305 RepID=I3SBK5_LOTJA|nr:unknown [Lotus japonicus]